MNQLNPLTGGRKMMNMAKLGTVSLFKNAFFADVNPLEAPPLLGFRAIHYAHNQEIETSKPGSRNTGHLVLYQSVTALSGTVS
jgi:hypothetical protein